VRADAGGELRHEDDRPPVPPALRQQRQLLIHGEPLLPRERTPRIGPTGQVGGDTGLEQDPQLPVGGRRPVERVPGDPHAAGDDPGQRPDDVQCGEAHPADVDAGVPQRLHEHVVEQVGVPAGRADRDRLRLVLDRVDRPRQLLDPGVERQPGLRDAVQVGPAQREPGDEQSAERERAGAAQHPA
jgi:hypothetical protein